MTEPELLRSDQPATIDWAHLARQTADDAELAAELLTLFDAQARDIAQRLAAPSLAAQSLATPRASGDDKMRRDLVHTLKGSSAAIGAFEVMRAAEACEAALAAGADAAALLATLDRVLVEALAEIAARLVRR